MGKKKVKILSLNKIISQSFKSSSIKPYKTFELSFCDRYCYKLIPGNPKGITQSHLRYILYCIIQDILRNSQCLKLFVFQERQVN